MFTGDFDSEINAGDGDVIRRRLVVCAGLGRFSRQATLVEQGGIGGEGGVVADDGGHGAVSDSDGGTLQGGLFAVIGRGEGEGNVAVLPVQAALLHDLRVGADVKGAAVAVQAEFAVGLPVGFFGVLAQGQGNFAAAVAVNVKDARILAAVAPFVLPGESFLQFFQFVLLFALGTQQFFAHARQGVQLALDVINGAVLVLQTLDEGAAHVAVVFDGLAGDGQRLFGGIGLFQQRVAGIRCRQWAHTLPGEAGTFNAEGDVGDVVAEQRRDDQAVRAVLDGYPRFADEFGFIAVQTRGDDRRVQFVIFSVRNAYRSSRQPSGYP